MGEPMTRISLITMLEEHAAFTRGLHTLVRSGAYAEADYIIAIIRTDLVEIGHVPADKIWPCPGEEAPVGWPIYKAALRCAAQALDGRPVPHWLSRRLKN
jgi:hypothetical protein